MKSVPISTLRDEWDAILEKVMPDSYSPATALVISIGPQWGSVTAGTISDPIPDERYFVSRDYYPYTQEFDLSHDSLFEAADGAVFLHSEDGVAISCEDGDDAFNEPIVSTFREWTIEFTSKRDHQLEWLWLGDHDRSFWKPTRLTRRSRSTACTPRVEI